MTDTGTGPGTEDGPAGLDPGTWRLAVVAGVRMDMPGEHPEVLVHEAVAPWRELAIPVGMAEGNAIAYAWRGLTTARPLTHALFTDVLERHGVELEAVRITARRGRSFFAELDTVGPRGRQVISCRPSDALALVLRQRMPTPVLVADSVFDPQDTETTGADDDAAPSTVASSGPAPESTAGAPVAETPVAVTPDTDSPITGTVESDAAADVTTPG
jgi:bifunctional DNase/RNase